MAHADSGTATTFESLLYPVLDAAYGAAMNLTRERADAEDLLQDATLNALRGFGGFIAGSNFKAWFFRILHNAFLARIRASKAERGDVDLDSAPELTLMQTSDGPGRRSFGEDPSLLAQLESEQVAAALQRLPDEYRVVATMYFIEEISYQEIADILDIPLGTVRSRLHRARKALQARLSLLARDHGLLAA